MSTKPDALSPSRIGAHRETLVDFLARYIAYAKHRHDMDPAELVKLRGAMMARLAAADAASKALGTSPAGFHRASGHQPQGLAEIVMFNEQLASVGNDAEDATVVDVLAVVIGRSEVWEAEARRRRRNPLWWIDRVLRAVLGLPTYLLGLIFRVPEDRIDASLPLRIVSVVADLVGLGFAVYAAGRWAGWW